MSVFIGYPSFMAYQMMKGKKDNNEGFPPIPGMIARYSALGLTNEEMSKNPVWVDKTGNGHDLQMKNFAWGEMSGVGGYVQNFNYFKNNATVYKVRIDEQNSNSIKVTILTTGIVNAGLSIHPQIHIFNQPEAIKIVFRTAGKTLPVKSLKAICSDGRCYDENWSELKINVGEFTDNKGTLFVASNGTNYAQIAFKNLGIYDNHILSKDDCIKAYNYLQTLKAK